jgi:hypothetical protein
LPPRQALVKEAGGELLRLQIMLQAVEETLAERNHSAQADPDDLRRLCKLRDHLRGELRARAARWN